MSATPEFRVSLVTKEIRETQDLLDLPVFLGQEVGDQCRV